MGQRSIRDTWDSEADAFDEQPDHGLLDPTVRAAWRELLEDVLPLPPAKVLDVGCGTGSLSILLAELGYDVTALDLAPRMLERARAKAEVAGVTVAFYEADASDPHHVGNRFDVVLGRHVVWLLPDPGAAFDRWLRLMSPRGRLVLIEGRWNNAGLPASELCEILRSRLRDIELRPLADESLWGKRIDDERYLLTGIG